MNMIDECVKVFRRFQCDSPGKSIKKLCISLLKLSQNSDYAIWLFLIGASFISLQSFSLNIKMIEKVIL